MTSDGKAQRDTVSFSVYEREAIEGIRTAQQLSTKNAAVGWAVRLTWRFLSTLAQHRERGEDARLELVVTGTDGKTRRETIWVI